VTFILRTKKPAATANVTPPVTAKTLSDQNSQRSARGGDWHNHWL